MGDFLTRRPGRGVPTHEGRHEIPHPLAGVGLPPDDGSMSTAAITAESLRVRRGRRTVLPDLTCQVAEGKVTDLLGPSGSGKTTFMRAVVGVQQVAGGRVTVLGRSAGSAELRHEVAYMTQTASVYRDLSVRENVGYHAALVGASGTRARDVIGQVGLREQARQLAGNLSGGQLSRVSLACALVGNPRLLVLDEPTVGQDPVLRNELWACFRERAAAGTTIIVSSHVVDEAARCDELLLLRDGKLLAQVSPPRLLEITGEADHDAAFLALITRSSTDVKEG